ncbi:MAG TPA: DegT/DnrJ/EryC1/StrS family aminotransferase [Polyangiaceae bacterium]|nr:DegT/DnrJ/EryC1/StrS family aminotransferase [Polyangiaceae bacterium]
MIPYLDLVSHNRGLENDLVAAVRRVIAHGQFILGPEVTELEQRLVTLLGARQVVSVGNGTDALVLALRVHGVGNGHEVILPSHSFIASATAVRLVGAVPVFADIDEPTMLLDVGAAERAITPKTRAIMPVHLNGYPCDMPAFEELCRRRKLALIEDCAQAFGSLRGGKHVGTFGTGCFSLHPLKALSALGDGGFISVQADEPALTLRQWRNLGLLDRDHCIHVSGNSRLDTLQAAFLLTKLLHFPAWRAARHAHAQAYRQALEGKVMLPPASPDADATVTAFVIRHPRRDALIEAMHRRGVDCKIHYPFAIHQHEAFADLPRTHLPVTERVVQQIVSLPVTPELSPSDRDRAIQAMSDSLAEVGSA